MFDDVGLLELWLKEQLPGQIAAVQRFTIFCDQLDAPICSLPNLKSLEVWCPSDDECGGQCWADPALRKAIEDKLMGIWVVKPVRTIRSGSTKTAKPKTETHAADMTIQNKRLGYLPLIRRLYDDMVDVTPFGKYEAM
ncbi:hypothetical protein J4E89_006179 [Alternaria sp. Ai002NY15]|nr:hypothetical protein J4E89_006179 [Alternaria sp. Ai002NY15]